MIRIQLPAPQLASLEHAFRTTPDRQVRDRAQIVLLASRGRPRQQIAADLGVAPRTVQRWLNAYLDRGLDGLRPRKAPGAAEADRRPGPRPPAVGHRRAGRLRAGPGQLGLRRIGRLPVPPARHPGAEVGHAGLLPPARHPAVPAHLQVPPGRPGQAGDRPRGPGGAKKGARAGALVLPSRDEARFPMVPTLCRTPGVKGHRPAVGTRDRKGMLHVSAAVHVTTPAPHTKTVACRTGLCRRTGEGQTRRLQRTFAAHLRRIAARYPAETHRRVVLVTDNAPWHAGEPVREALADHPHLELYRLPSYSPRLNVIERFWKLLRRRATHNRLFDTLADLRRSVRSSLSYVQTVRTRLRALIANCYPRPVNQTPSAGP